MSEEAALPCAAPYLSIVIPTLNEEAFLPATLEALDTMRDEVIVVDAGSTDRTAAIASAGGTRVLQAPRGRARQMNAGANVATGEVLLFLHADTKMPRDYEPRIRETIAHGAGGGAFGLRIDAPGPVYRLIEWGIAFRSNVMKTPYGDQALFARRSQFETLGGFRDLPIMEDHDMAQRLRRLTVFKLLDATVLTSARRWTRSGPIRMTALNQLTLLAYAAGVPAHHLAHLYETLARPE
jgi:rSAM/selenodomain-associated transferase 2